MRWCIFNRAKLAPITIVVGKYSAATIMSIFLTLVLLLLLAPIAAFCLYVAYGQPFGRILQGEASSYLEASDNWRDGYFQNVIETKTGSSFWETVKSTYKFMTQGQDRRPKPKLAVKAVHPSQLERLDAGRTVVTWLGHSALILQIDGQRWLLDPMLGKRVSPVDWFGPSRFCDAPPLVADQIPDVDVVVISHDHWDHLDHRTIKKIHGRVGRFVVALGVKSHLVHWGVEAAKITELDWHESVQLGGVQLTATPSRHFSGRKRNQLYKTFWASFVIDGPAHKLFFGSDSGYFDGFRQIGAQYGPFDLTLLECGAYSEYWPDIHMMPEETAQAHLDLGGRILMPIHWAAFSLSLHPWREPIERLLKVAAKKHIKVIHPMVGGHYELGGTLPRERWWEKDYCAKPTEEIENPGVAEVVSGM